MIGGPSCDAASQIVWWKVGDVAASGWTAEGQLPDHYFLMPIESMPPATINPSATPAPSTTPTQRFQVMPIGSAVLIVGTPTPTPTPRFQIALPGHLGLVTTPTQSPLIIHR